MSLSLSTLGLFILLLPGAIFRYRLYHGSNVKRAFLASNTLFSSLIILFYSIIVQIATLLIIVVLLNFLDDNEFYDLDFDIIFSDHSERILLFYNHSVFTINSFLVQYLHVAIVYLIVCLIVAWNLSKFIQYLSGKVPFFARIMYGPLSNLLMSSDAAVLTAFVLTKISHENRRMIYAGIPVEIGLKDGSKIDYMVVDLPEKFYLKLNRSQPVTSFKKARPISTEFGDGGTLFISGDEIENVHFESWFF